MCRHKKVRFFNTHEIMHKFTQLSISSMVSKPARSSHKIRHGGGTRMLALRGRCHRWLGFSTRDVMWRSRTFSSARFWFSRHLRQFSWERSVIFVEKTYVTANNIVFTAIYVFLEKNVTSQQALKLVRVRDSRNITISIGLLINGLHLIIAFWKRKPNNKMCSPFADLHNVFDLGKNAVSEWTCFNWLLIYINRTFSLQWAWLKFGVVFCQLSSWVTTSGSV